jgi:hypothetical protein
VAAAIRYTSGASLIDVLDRVLDKGVVVDAGMRVSLAGIDLISVESHLLVASFDTYLRHAAAGRSSGFAGVTRNGVGQTWDTGSRRR